MRKPGLSNISRIVVRGTNWVGDTVMSIPALRGLRRLFPSARITLWASAGLVPLIRATEVADDVITFDGAHGGPLTRPFRIRHDLTLGEFDMAVLFQNAFESAFTAWLAGIPIRVGFPTDLRGPLLSLQVPLTDEIRRKHQVFYYLAITDHLEKRILGTSNESEPDCSVRISRENMDAARKVLSDSGVNPDGPFFCLCPGSVNSEAKRWPAENFAVLADLLMKSEAAVVFLGAPSEWELINGIIESMRGTGVNLAGRTGMIDSMAVMSLSDMVISNDTGSAHLAVAASAAVLTIFGPTIPGATAPYGPRAHIIRGTAECAPCRHFRCLVPAYPCMKSITPEAVLETVGKIRKT
jgi:heptosyltransferase II